MPVDNLDDAAEDCKALLDRDENTAIVMAISREDGGTDVIMSHDSETACQFNFTELVGILLANLSNQAYGSFEDVLTAVVRQAKPYLGRGGPGKHA